MPIYSIQAPNGKTYSIEGPAGASQDEVIDEVLRQHPDAGEAAKPKEGLLAALGKGAESTLSAARTGIGALLGSPEEAATAGLARGEDIGKRYADQTSLERVKQAYEKSGILPAAGEVISQVPAAIAEQAPNIAATLAAARAGSMAGAPLGGVGRVVGGLGGAAAAIAPQIFGSNIERQAAEQQKAGLPTNIDVGAAALATAPATALDVAGTFIPLGGRLVSKLTGIPAGSLFGKTAESTAKLAEEKLLATLAKGTATGAMAEIPTEVAQQMLERAQAGLALTSEEALKEYGETAYQVGLLAPIGAAGRYAERGGARAEVEAKAELEKRKARIEALGAEEEAAKVQQAADLAEAARKQTPEFALEAEQKYNALTDQFKTLREQANAKVDQNDPAAVAAKKDAAAQLKALKTSDEFKNAVTDFRATKGIRAQLTQEQTDTAAAKAAADQETSIRAELAAMGQAPGIQTQIPGLAPVETVTQMPELEPAEVTDYAQQVRQLKQLDEDQQTQIAKTADPKELLRLLDLQDKTRAALEEATKAAAATPKAVGDQIASVARRLEIAKEEGDSAKIRKYAQQLIDLKAAGVEPTPVQEQIPLAKFKGTSETEEFFKQRVVGPEMAAGREAAAERRAQLESEIERIRALKERASDTEYARLTREERQTQLEIEEMEKQARMDRGVTEQGTLFGEPVRSLTYTGAGVKPETTMAELTAKFKAARETGNRAEAANAIEAMRDLREQLSQPRRSGTTEITTSTEKTDTERTYTPTTTTPEALRAELDAAFTKTLSPEQRTVLEGVADNLKAFGADAGRRDLAAAYAYRVNSGIEPAAELTADIQKELAALESGKQSETEGGKTAIQPELFADVINKGTLFPSQAEFDAYLAGDALQAMRSAMGSTHPTISRLLTRVAPLQKRVEELRTKMDGLRFNLEQEEQRRETEPALAKQMAAEAQARIDAIATQLDGELLNLQAAYMEARAAYSFSVQVSEDISKAIAANAQTFSKDEDAALQRVVAAKENLARLTAEQNKIHLSPKYTFEQQNSQDWEASLRDYDARVRDVKDNKVMRDAQAEVTAALRSYRAYAALNQVNRKVVGFLDNDLRFQLELQNELARLDSLTEKMLNAAFELTLAKQAQTPTTVQTAALKAAETDLAAANKMAVEAAENASVNMQALSTELKALSDERVKVERVAANALAAIKRKQAQRLSKGVPESQADREDRDNAERKAEQERVESLNAMEGNWERVSFEKRTKLLEALDAAPANEALLDSTITSPDSTAEDVAKATTKKERLQSTVDQVGKQFSSDPEIAAAAIAAVEARITKLYANITKVTAAVKEKGIAPTLRASRLKDLNKYKRELASAIARRDANRGIERIEMKNGRPVIATAEAIEPGTRLGTRKIGPVVKPTVVAGNVRTGVAETLAERTLSSKSKITQAGQKRPETNKQAQRGGNVAAIAALEARVVEARKDALAAYDVLDKTSMKAKDSAKYDAALSKVNEADRVLDTRKEELAIALAQSKPKKPSKVDQALKEIEEAGDVDIEADLKLGGALYRTTTRGGPTLATEEVSRLTDRITENWKNVPEIVVVATEQELPLRILGQLVKGDREKVTPGLFDPKSGRVYLIASNLHSANDVALTVAHEVAGHFGLRDMLGGTYTTTMDSLYAGNLTVRRQADAKMNADSALSQQVAVEEVLADMAETGGVTPAEKGALRRIYDTLKAWLRKTLGLTSVSDAEVQQLVANARKQVMEGGVAAEGRAPEGQVLRRNDPTYANDEFATVGNVADKFVSKQRGVWDRVQANNNGLVFETSYVDRLAGFERLSKQMESLKGYQMMYFLRMYDQRMNFVAQSVANGALRRVEKTRPDGRKEFVIEAGGGASLKNVVEILKQAGPMVGNGEAINRIFTTYMSAIRAKDKGFAALHFGTELTQADLDKATAVVNGNPQVKAIFEEARKEYNEYNRDMMNFAVQSGAIPADLAARLLKENDYIPWYREENGVALLQIGSEAPIRIGSIAEQPHLHELVGGDKPILDFMTSSVQNTNMLTDMSLRNLATKNAVMELANMGLAKIGKGTATGTDVVKFKVDGEDRFAIIDTDSAGVPADLLVKGMEGIPTQMSGVLRMLAAPATLLRKAVMASPLYTVRQIFRDSLAAPILAGADFVPVIGALRQIGASATKTTLERRGITGGQVFTGTSEDLSRILKDIAGNKVGWAQAWGKLESVSMEADASTRRAQYNSYIAQGLSEMEATLMALESMNFNKRGASPSIHVIASMIPFFNAQIQSLNVLYKALFGKMPFNEKLKIQQKLLTRGFMLAGGTLAYAAAMQDDEAYQNATPEQKYGNWFVRVPGVAEAVRIPIPFEIGYIFKALPEALYNTMVTKHGGEDAVKAFTEILKNTIPGGSNYGIPQAMKPAIEAGLGKSFYTGRDILSAQEQGLLPQDQFRVNTTELSKTVGKAAGISPIKIDEFIKGYTGGMGLAFVQAVSIGIPKGETPENATKRLSELPVVGGAFQPNDAGQIANRVYDRMKDVQKVQNSFDEAIKRGDKSGAMEMLSKYGNELVLSETADFYTSTMNEITQYERAIRASNLSPEEKRIQLDKLRQTKTRFAATVEAATDKTTPR